MFRVACYKTQVTCSRTSHAVFPVMRQKTGQMQRTLHPAVWRREGKRPLVVRIFLFGIGMFSIFLLFYSNFLSYLFFYRCTNLTIPPCPQLHHTSIFCIARKRLLPLARAISCTLSLQLSPFDFWMRSTCLAKTSSSSLGERRT